MIATAVWLLTVLVQMLGMAVLPESPVWLLWRGKKGLAAAAQKRILGDEWQSEDADSDADDAPLVSNQEVSSL